MKKTAITIAVLTASAVLFAGCGAASGPSLNLQLQDIPAAITGTPQSLAAAATEKRNSVLRENVTRWNDAQSGGDADLARARAAIAIGRAAGSCPWGLRGVEILDGILADNPASHRARAWRGAAMIPCLVKDEALLSPVDFLPLPPVLDAAAFAGDIAAGSRDAKRAVKMYEDLDGAVAAAPRDPVVRLLRASTFAFTELDAATKWKGGGRNAYLQTIKDDFALLEGWTDNPGSNPDFAEYLASREWKKTYYLLRARGLAEKGVFSEKQTPESRKAWENLRAISDDKADRDLADWYLKP